MDNWKDELQKCIDSPYYFYVNYCKVEHVIPSEKYSESDFNELIKQGLTIRQIIDE